jgi:hypothetical protein
MNKRLLPDTASKMKKISLLNYDEGTNRIAVCAIAVYQDFTNFQERILNATFKK